MKQGLFWPTEPNTSTIRKLKIKSMEPITSAKARSEFSDLLARTFYQNKIFVIKKSKRPMGVLLSPEEFEKISGQKISSLKKQSK